MSRAKRAHAGRRAEVQLCMVALVLPLLDFEPALAQMEQLDACTERMIVGTVGIGHDCGEWATIVVAGRLVHRRPWSRVNRASRAERLRARREGRVPGSTIPVTATQQCHPAYGGCLAVVADLDCEDIGFQQVPVFDLNVDPYELDDATGPGDGITCNGDG